MAEAKECDRCNKIYGSREGIFKDLGILDRDESRMDLCPSCASDLDAFFDYEFEKIEEVEELLKKSKTKNKGK